MSNLNLYPAVYVAFHSLHDGENFNGVHECIDGSGEVVP